MGYHVQCNPDSGIIHAGTVNKQKTKWVNKTDVTNEVLEAARDHLLFIAAKNELQEGVGYRWERNDGTAIVLKAEIVPIEQIAESKEEAEGQAPQEGQNEPPKLEVVK